MELTFSGVYPASCGERQRSFSVLDRDQYFYGLFVSLWRELGGTLFGGVRASALPEQAQWFATWESPALTEVVRDINKFSNNVMARQLFLTLSLTAVNPPVTTQGAVEAVRAWLSRAQLDFPELHLENGSGLSRSERISARHLGELLLYARRSPFMAEFIASLPIPGMDGTLRRRLTNSGAMGRAHLKTGYLAGVRAIAGYIDDSQGNTLVVVSLINDPNAGQAQAFQDALVDWAYSYNAAMRN
jgi:D-alanyl-D-alanine carboxypeptidase/D-alanyl-D-alanine-endopeptidase (penicillin-binding protein 4)